MEPRSKLSGAEVQRFQDALLSAFPTRSALAQMVRVGLEENLDAVAAPENLSVAIFELIKWAEAQGRVEELVDAARKVNPRNPMLLALSEGLGNYDHDPVAPAPSQTSATRVELVREGDASQGSGAPHPMVPQAHSAQGNTIARPTPNYVSTTIQLLSEQLEQAYDRKKRLVARDADTRHVDQEILECRRKIREGGQLRAGDRLGANRYLLLDEIGRGGFGVVWKAYDNETNNTVAIKILDSNLAGDSQRLARFFRGAKIMAELKDEAVVRVLESQAEDAGWHYFVMEYVAGGDLRTAVLEQRLPRERGVDIMLPICVAMSALHQKGILHRDIKPANVILDLNRQPKLTDFDLVTAPDTTGGTRPGALGTVTYTAPEAMDHPESADARADVYSLGMTILFCLYGRELPKTELGHPEIIVAAAVLSGELRATLEKATCWEDRDARYADASALHTALVKALAHDGGVRVAEVPVAEDRRRPVPSVVVRPRDTVIRILTGGAIAAGMTFVLAPLLSKILPESLGNMVLPVAFWLPIVLVCWRMWSGTTRLQWALSVLGVLALDAIFLAVLLIVMALVMAGFGYESNNPDNLVVGVVAVLLGTYVVLGAGLVDFKLFAPNFTARLARKPKDEDRWQRWRNVLAASGAMLTGTVGAGAFVHWRLQAGKGAIRDLQALQGAGTESTETGTECTMGELDNRPGRCYWGQEACERAKVTFDGGQSGQCKQVYCLAVDRREVIDLDGGKGLGLVAHRTEQCFESHFMCNLRKAGVKGGFEKLVRGCTQENIVEPP